MCRKQVPEMPTYVAVLSENAFAKVRLAGLGLGKGLPIFTGSQNVSWVRELWLALFW